MDNNLGAAIRARPMTAYQVGVVALCVLINSIDGYDILAISFAAPAIQRELLLDPERMGFLYSIGLAGIGIGALLFAFIADIVGRRPVILFGTVLIAIGMLATAWADSVSQLAVCRLTSGLGIGSMVSTAGTLAIEYSSRRWRTMSVALVVLGYPVGGTIGGFIAAELLVHQGWRSLFLFGASLSAVLLPVLLWRLPESIDFLLERQPKNALQRINRYAARMGLPPLAALPPRPAARTAREAYRDLLQQPLLRTTTLLCVAYFGYMFSFYFILSWATSLVTRLGLADTAGVTTTAMINAGGLVGGLWMGYLATRRALPPMLKWLMLGMAVSIAAFGWLPPSLVPIYIGSTVLGFLMWGASATVYSAIALSYPVRLRATGIGIVVTAGRIGSIAGPYLAGVMLKAGMRQAMVTLLLALPAVAAALMFARSRPEPPHD